MNTEIVTHPLEPIWTKQSRVLILGTMPSPRSRQDGFYYAHPQNRFWKVLSAVYDESLPQTKEEKRAFLSRHHIALWDVLAGCRISGASDASIRDPVPNDMTNLLLCSQIHTVFTTGGTAFRLYQRLLAEKAGIPAIPLPSTSPANARTSLSVLIDAYRIIKNYTE